MKERFLFSGFQGANGFFRNNKALLVFFTTFVISFIIGALCIKNCSDLEFYGIPETFTRSFTTIKSSSFLFGILISMAKNSLIILLPFLFGFFAFGGILDFAICFLKGFGIGMVGGYLVSAFGLKGIGYYALILLPGSFIISFTLIFACKESFMFSLHFASLILPSSIPYNLFSQFKRYCKRFAVRLVFVLFCGIVDSAMATMFIGFFDF